MVWHPAGLVPGPLIPLGAVLFSLSPRPLREREDFWRSRNRPAIWFSDVQRAAVWAVRLEFFAIVSFFALLHWFLHLQWTHTLILYACFSFNWSTRQYVGHAFSKRDVIEGAAGTFVIMRLCRGCCCTGSMTKTHTSQAGCFVDLPSSLDACG